MQNSKNIKKIKININIFNNILIKLNKKKYKMTTK